MTSSSDWSFCTTHQLAVNNNTFGLLWESLHNPLEGNLIIPAC